MGIGEILFSRRKELGLTLQDVAILSDTSRTQIWKIENNEAVPRWDTVLRLARVLKLKVNIEKEAVQKT